MRLFEGFEAEGRFRGVWTLFVDGDVPFGLIKAQLANKRFATVYFGAGGCSEINWDTVKLTLREINIVAAEISAKTCPPNLSVLCHDNLFPIINIQRFGKESLAAVLQCVGRSAQIKFDTTDRTFIAPYTAFFSNYKSDCHKDKELWRSYDV